MSEQREALAEVVAHADHCHGLVTRDGIEDACGKPPVAIIDGRSTEDQCYWPACAYHAHRDGRGNVVPLARLLAYAEQRGAAKVRLDRERHFALGKEAGRAEVAAAEEAVLREYDPCCPPEGCGCTKCDLVDDLRAALTTGAGDRVRAEEGGDRG